MGQRLKPKVSSSVNGSQGVGDANITNPHKQVDPSDEFGSFVGGILHRV